MDIQKLSKKYVVKRLENSDIQDIFRLCCENKLYYEYCPPMVTAESIRKDMLALPPGVKNDDKFYIGYYADETLIAVMDLLCGYPTPSIAYIGFFMVNAAMQKRGIGSEIISQLCDYLKTEGFASIRLAWVKGNPQAEHFWLKNQFVVLKETTSDAADSVILAEKGLIDELDSVFFRSWMKGLEKGLDSLDEVNRTCLLKHCAKSCADTGVLEKHQKLYDAVNHDRDAYYRRLSETGRVTGEVSISGKEYILTYPECGCDLHMSCGLSSDSLCECSRQSILYVEQSVTNESISVEQLASVLAGDKVCRFRIRFEGLLGK